MDSDDITFPEEFLWGTATSAYQIEGGNTNADWYRYEHAPGTRAVEPCGDACDSWHRYQDDLDLVQDLGLNAFRFSIEWSRIEPRHGTFSTEAIDHYRNVIEACLTRDIVPVVTLHHFTLPLWAADEGGFESPEIVSWMADYARVVSREYGDMIGVACTINEPNIVAVYGYLYGIFPPQVTSWDRFVQVNATMRECHRAMRDILKEGPGDFPVGLPLSMQEYEALPGYEHRMESIREEMEDKYLEAVRGDDFLGVQCYTKLLIGRDGVVTHPEGETTDMGYLFWPQCVESTVRRAISLAGVRVVVTENGIGTTNDEQRIRYVSEALRGVHALLDDGLDVRGYFQWSLLDNFEWALGYRPKFGIVDVDRTSFERTPKPSAVWYADAARNFFTTA
ncbi:MAG TPA: family 1 glycosylhydrolase [Acidimicrobiales bacterium]|nr:family 1 glycosylhydrolase [Acidimicrobiales bacterium]